MRIKITKHKDSKTGLEQVIVSEGKNHIRFNIWLYPTGLHEFGWIGKSIGMGLGKEVTLEVTATRDEILEQVETIAQEYFNQKEK